MNMDANEFSTFELFIFDLFYCLIVQGLIGFVSAHLPKRVIQPERKIYRVRPWEKNGAIYQQWFKIKNWKWIAWDAGKVFQKDFSKDHVDTKDPKNLERWIIETCRAEWCHWVTFFLILPLFTFNPPGLMYFWFLYDTILNIVPIIIQRYNRPRLIHLLDCVKRITQKNTKTPEPEMI
jgi:glycosyl-4,4'-diaponeurosporenoate acyltransferase